MSPEVSPAEMPMASGFPCCWAHWAHWAHLFIKLSSYESQQLLVGSRSG